MISSRRTGDLYVARDRQIMRTGIPTINVVAPAPEEEGSNRLIIGSKFPLKDRQGRSSGLRVFTAPWMKRV